MMIKSESNRHDTETFSYLSEHQEPEEVRRPSVFANLDEHIIDQEEDDVSEELLTAVPIRRPSKKDFIRCHPKHRFTVKIYEDPGTGEIYYVHPKMRLLFTEEDGVKTVFLALYMTRRRTICFWPITTSTMGRWHDTALVAVTAGETRWIKIIAEKELSGYRVKPAIADYGNPDWGDHTLEKLLDLAFQGRVIDNPEQKVVRYALGQPL
jgi:hypothetical protein